MKVGKACGTLFGADAKPPEGVELTRPEEKFGDFSTNIALRLAKTLGKSPREIADALAAQLREDLADQVSEISVAGPGFINLRLNDATLLAAMDAKPARSYEGQEVIAEYSDPNPFKVLHAGHLYTSVVGDAIANLLEQAGAKVHRVNFGGDVGLHVAKTMWAILRNLGGADVAALHKIPVAERAQWLSKAYVEGTKAYDHTPQLVEEGGMARLKGDMPKLDIIQLNRIIYDYWLPDDQRNTNLTAENFPTITGSGSQQIRIADIHQIYKECRKWSYDYFDSFYKRIGTRFEKYYPESQTAPLGLKTVREHIGDVYVESDGAIIFDGEKHGLHPRVFINSEGLPTYEAKDVGLIIKKWDDYKFDLSVVITGNDIIEYMKVVLKSIEQFKPELSARSRHLTHGIVKLQGGTKMSSREGNILRAEAVLDAASKANRKLAGDHNEDTVLGAVKYAFLKNRTGGDIIYDPDESVSLEGNSGPYLQYAHARAMSILGKAGGSGARDHGPISDLDDDERSLVRKLGEAAEAVDRAVADMMPHHICTYLYELAQTFNRFYENSRVVGDPRQELRLHLVRKYAETLQFGLGLLGITAPDKM